jgi:hypothetical protein
VDAAAIGQAEQGAKRRAGRENNPPLVAAIAVIAIPLLEEPSSLFPVRS